MSHMVIYRGPDGSPGYHQADEVHDAVAFVEQLRNDKGVEEAKIFRMEEVTFEYRPYFRVELTASDRSLASPASTPAVTAAPAETVASTASSVADTPATAADTPATAADTPAAESAASAAGASGSAESNGDVGARRGLFGR